jgi:hypothetical protein
MPIETLEAFVEALGGSHAVADYAQVENATVDRWLQHGHIPNGFHLRLYLVARDLGLVVDRRVFGVDLPENER